VHHNPASKTRKPVKGFSLIRNLSGCLENFWFGDAIIKLSQRVNSETRQTLGLVKTFFAGMIADLKANSTTTAKVNGQGRSNG